LPLEQSSAFCGRGRAGGVAEQLQQSEADPQSLVIVVALGGVGGQRRGADAKSLGRAADDLLRVGEREAARGRFVNDPRRDLRSEAVEVDVQVDVPDAAGELVECILELKTTIYVVAADRAALVQVWDVVSRRLGRAPSTLLGVSHLGYPEQLVEIEAVAAAPG
jgi:hypothetical protein